MTVEQALRTTRAAVDGPIEVRDVGLLESAEHRPRASVLGHDAYPDLFAKAAALLHSLAGNHPPVDGNKRLAWLATSVLLAKNGVELDPDDAAAYDFVIAVAVNRRRFRSPRPRTAQGVAELLDSVHLTPSTRIVLPLTIPKHLQSRT